MSNSLNRIASACLPVLMAIAIITSTRPLYAQNVAINDDGTAPHASAMLDIKVNAAAKKGLLIPRMTSAQRSAIASPAAGLMVYDTDTQSFWYWNASAWTNLAAGGGSGPWAQVGSRIYNTNTGNVGIGTTNPRAKLNVAAGRPVLFGLDTSGVGVKAFWLPSKAAFRAGVIDDPFAQGTPFNWDYSEVGYGSFAAGGDALARGDYSAAFGRLPVATGSAAFAAGFIAQAMGDNSAAFGTYSAAQGYGSFAANQASVNGELAAAFNYAYADGNAAFAANEGAAEAPYSAAFGMGNSMKTNSGFAVGEYGTPMIGDVSLGGSIAAPLFYVGNGSYGNLRNAFTITRSGHTAIGRLPSVGSQDAPLQIKAFSTSHALQLEQASTINRWGFHVSPHLQLFYNGVLRGTFSNSTGGYTAVSDIRLKKDMIPLGSVLNQLMNMTPYTYHLKDNNEHDPVSFGFMAQEVEKIMPDLVTKLTNGDGQPLLGMNYSNFGVLAVRAIQEVVSEMRNENLKLETKVKEQEERIRRLESIIDKLQK